MSKHEQFERKILLIRIKKHTNVERIFNISNYYFFFNSVYDRPLR